MIHRFSSRTHKLDESFLNRELRGAASYDRIAGYFSSSLLEVAGEAIDSLTGKIRILCNSDLDARDVQTAQAAARAIRQEWCASEPEKKGDLARPRFKKLYELLLLQRLEIRVLPSDVFGLVHGKAGVITRPDGSQTCFMGSANETYSGWRMNYELVWQDDSPEAIRWVQDEFDALWSHPAAQPLAEAVIADIGRIAHRVEVSLPAWRATPDPAAPVVESPVYRHENGLWAHQKYFVKKAFEAHRRGGARYVLADQVGLGKTIQLALAAYLMALYGDKPVLVLAPKTLIWQWQDEIRTLLDMPSAVWNGRQWIDENGVEYAAKGVQELKNCPRRVGIVSQGLITSGGEAGDVLRTMEFECVIVDEAHRARRRQINDAAVLEQPEPNNLMRFICAIGPRTKSLLLATATPVQLHPVEAYDLLYMLAKGNDGVLGTEIASFWRRDYARKTLDLVLEQKDVPTNFGDVWNFMRNPLPWSDEDTLFAQVRSRLELPDNLLVAPLDREDRLGPALKRRIGERGSWFFQHANPFIRHIVRRTRSYLENTIDPATKEPYLKPVRVQLFGEQDRDAIRLPGYLEDAYRTAEEFCQELAGRVEGAGFLKTLLLRRVGSSIEAGRLTAEKMLASWSGVGGEDDSDYEEAIVTTSKTLTATEQTLLNRFIAELTSNQERDPKFDELQRYLITKKWLDLGCIVFSQYYDTVRWHAFELTKLLPTEPIAIYAGSNRSAIVLNGTSRPVSKEEIKAKVKSGDIRLVFGTDAASEGLNLQRLGSLINIDLPWNPTRLEQRKGRIQRIGQLRDTVLICNMRYLGSVEDRVHQLLSERLENIKDLFGQLPDVLEDAWVDIALGDQAKASERIQHVPSRHPFEMKYDSIERVDWETCSTVLNDIERKQVFLKGW
ncbi:phospholipase D-like domain-containing anti-phage protein [Fibrella sp. ES10-3-2-2]|nr:helicase SNF2 [Fibrella sp. ES10-3-2-2]